MHCNKRGYAFLLEGKGYEVIENTIYEMDPDTEKWSKVCEAPGNMNGGFPANGNLYLFGKNNTLYKFNPSQKEIVEEKQVSQGHLLGGAFVQEMNGQVYVLSNNEIVRWDIENLEPHATMKKLDDRKIPASLVQNGKILLIGGFCGYNNMLIFDPVIQEQIDQIKQQQ